MQINDGIGRGYLLKVDSKNRAHVMATRISEIGYVAQTTNDSYTISTNSFTFNSTNEHPIVYIKNTNSTKKLSFTIAHYGWNGGDTNYNRCMIKRVYKNISPPTANYESLVPQNTYFESLRTADANVYKWDESASDGMTVDTSGLSVFSTSCVSSGGVTLSDFIECVILDYNSSILFTYQPEEIGKASLTLYFFFNYCHCD